MASEAIALVCDAGTPLISDPGYKLVRDARQAGRRIVTIPGPCAAIAALTLSGLPTDRFFFLGFLPDKAAAQEEALKEVAMLRATLIIYESGKRLGRTLARLARQFGDRPAAVAREISKMYEDCVDGSLSELATRYAGSPVRGEIVIMVGPPLALAPASEAEADVMLADALKRLSPAKAASEVARALGLDRRRLYERALTLPRD